MLLIADNGSIYTKNLTQFLSKIQKDFKLVTHDKITDSEIQISNSIILSGRRKNNQKMNVINSKLIRHAVKEKKPLLGICYGAEIMALTLGGTIKARDIPCKGLEKVSIIKQNSLCSGTIEVFESHGYEISSLVSRFSVLGESKNCQRELIQYANLDIYGTQFHPEMTEDGKELIENFTNL